MAFMFGKSSQNRYICLENDFIKTTNYEKDFFACCIGLLCNVC